MEYVEKPGVITWYKVYCLLMALMYLAVLALGIVLAVVPAEELDIPQDEAAFLIGYVIILIGLGLAMGMAYLAGVFLPPKPWVWIYGIVLIAIGLTSCCTMVFSIPLLIFWIKPETKAYFGR